MPMEPCQMATNSLAENFTYISNTDDNSVGTVSWNGAMTKAYKWVKVLTTASQAAVAGDLVVYKALTGYGLSLTSHDASADGDAVPIAAGALVSALTATQSTTGIFCWVQIKGLSTLSTAVTSAAAGKVFVASTTDKIGTVRADNFSPAAGISVNTTTGAIMDCPF